MTTPILSAERKKTMLTGCRDLMLHRTRLQLATAMDRLAEVLLDSASKSFEPKVVSTLMESRGLLQAERAAITESFSEALAARIDGKRATGIPDRKVEAVDQLSLQSDEVLDEFVAARSLSRSIESACLADVPPFHQRIAFLRSDAELKLAENPFAPPSVVGSLLDALLAVDTTGDVRLAWLRGLTMMGGLGFRDVYSDLNRFLSDGGVGVPAIRAGGGAAAGGQAGMPGGSGAAGAYGGDAAVSSAQAMDGIAAAMHAAMGIPGVAHGYGQGGGQMMQHGFAGEQPMQALASNLVSLVSRLQHMVPGLSGGPDTTDPSLVAMLREKEALQVSAALGFSPSGGYRPALAHGIDRSLLASLSELQAMPNMGTMQVGGTPVAPSASVLRSVVPGYTTGDISVLDATTTELVAMVFDFVFARPELRDEIKVVLGRLQIPMLKAAMVDRGFFSRKNHPARQLLNRLSDLGIGWNVGDGVEDSTYQKIKAVVEQINRDFVDDLGVFTGALVDVEQFISEIELDAQPAIDAETAEAETADRHLAAMNTAKHAVESRFAQQPLPEPIREFIEVAWQPHLQDALLDEGPGSIKYEEAVGALDELIWSVTPKSEPSDRAQLSKRVPALVKRLRKTLKSLSDETVNPFFDRLFEVHTGLLKGAEPEYVEPIEVAELEEIDESDPFTQLVRQMERNQWIEMSNEKGELTYAKLAWMSPQGTTYLFTTRHGRKAASLSPMELAEWFRTDRARLIEAEPIVDRALAGMFKAA
jgi:hypothetical protein